MKLGSVDSGGTCLNVSMTLVLVYYVVQSPIFAIDKIVSLAMYGLAASCVAEVLGLKLRLLLAVGGVSGMKFQSNLCPFFVDYMMLFRVPVAVAVTLAC